MDGFWQALARAVGLIAGGDAELIGIVGLSLRVTLSAVAVACLIGLPLGAAVGAFRFPGRAAASVALNALMGLPPVVVGLVVYLMLSAAGPFGVLGLLYTPAAMIIAQFHAGRADHRRPGAPSGRGSLGREYEEQLALARRRARRRGLIPTLLWDAPLLADDRGRWPASAGPCAEVGAVMIVGGNIDHVTRVDDHRDRARNLEGQSRAGAGAGGRAGRDLSRGDRGGDDAPRLRGQAGLCLRRCC